MLLRISPYNFHLLPQGRNPTNWTYPIETYIVTFVVMVKAKRLSMWSGWQPRPGMTINKKVTRQNHWFRLHISSTVKSKFTERCCLVYINVYFIQCTSFLLIICPIPKINFMPSKAVFSLTSSTHVLYDLSTYNCVKAVLTGNSSEE